MRCLLFLWSGAALSRLDVGFFILRGCLNKNKASLFYVFLLYSANINRGFRRGFLRTENRKRILPHKRTDFVTFALRRSDCSLAGSFLSEAVLSGRTERLTPREQNQFFYAVKFLSCFRLFVKYPSVYSFGRTDSFS